MNLKNGIPKKITPDPIIDANFEIRFQSDYPENAVFGVIYGKISEGYPEFKSTGIPNELRQKDPNLRYMAEAHISNEKFIIGISSRTFFIGCKGDYKGWNDYKIEIDRVLSNVLDDPRIFKKIDRIGMRYINFFPNEKSMNHTTEMKIDFTNSDEFEFINTQTRVELERNGYRAILNCADNAKVLNRQEEGSIVDVDIFKNIEESINKADIMNIAEELHDNEKYLFYSIINPSIIENRNPEY